MPTFADQTQPRFNGPPSHLPRGLVRPPQELLDRVSRERVQFPPAIYNDDYAKRTLDDWTLAYYYEGLHVAYRSVPEGVEVLAVGEDEIGELVKGKSQEELLTFTVKQP